MVQVVPRGTSNPTDSARLIMLKKMGVHNPIQKESGTRTSKNPAIWMNTGTSSRPSKYAVEERKQRDCGSQPSNRKQKSWPELAPPLDVERASWIEHYVEDCMTEPVVRPPPRVRREPRACFLGCDSLGHLTTPQLRAPGRQALRGSSVAARLAPSSQKAALWSRFHSLARPA
jgi:hypothetical protein